MISHEGASGNVALCLADGASAPVSALSQGRFRYNNTLSRLEYSENGGPWTPLVGGGWTDDGLVVRLTTATDTVSIGNNLMLGTEKLRVTAGSVLFDGAVGAVPVSGAGTRFMWSPATYSLRAGQVSGAQWDAANVGLGSVAVGKDTMAPGDASFAAGETTSAEAKWSTALGTQTRASRMGQVATSSGTFGAQGDLQHDLATMLRRTTDATITDLTLDGLAPAGAALPTSNRFILEDNKSYLFQILVEARSEPILGVVDKKAWSFLVHVTRDAGAGTTSLVGPQTKTIVSQTAGADTWDANITADAVNGAMLPRVSGQVGKNVRWGAGIRWIEVGT